MEIKLTKVMRGAIWDVLVSEPFNMSDRHTHFQSVVELDLRNYQKVDIERLKEAVDENLTVRGMKTLSNDLKMYLSIAFNVEAAKTIRMSGVKKAEIVFYNRFAPLERRHLYRRVEDGDEVRWLAYNLESISFEPRTKYTPEHLTFHLTFLKRGEERTASFSLYPLEIIGNSPDYAIQSTGWKLENPVLRDNYLTELETYESYVDNVGKQFLASGLASDDVSDDSSWRWRGSHLINMDKEGEKSQVVIDVETEGDRHRDKKAGRSKSQSSSYWKKANELLLKVNGNSDKVKEEDLEESEEAENELEVEVPVHPYVTIFDLKRHSRLSIHVGNLEEYRYDESIRNKLVLPEEHTQVLECLMSQDKSEFSDVVKNKSGGTIILSQGPPGTGKTLTAEIYAEAMKKPLYTVQCSQLGLTLDSLEKNLTQVLKRGSRWNAVTLLDEADVYVYHRGNDLHQNAVVGVFLRILEYHTGVLFLTTNRGDLVDDAILSRCTVRIPYGIPKPSDQKKIWKNIAASNGIDLDDNQIDGIVALHNDLSGRDIKNLLKLILMVYKDPSLIDCETVSKMRTFKPTTKVNE